MRYDYDVIVVGGGHAGCEAAVASANLGARTLLITSDLNRVAQMSCNPAVGGIAKGQIVREIDALGGQMGIVADLTAVQFRMLNRSKGPAVWSPRVQSDRTRFIDTWRRILDSTDGLDLVQDTVVSLLLDGDAQLSVSGVQTALGLIFHAPKVVLTAGTFLNGLMHFGPVKVEGGRISESGVASLTSQLVEIGFRVDRMKTGTPVRIDGRSIDMSLVSVQPGDDIVEKEDSSSVEDSSVPAWMRFHKDKIKRDFHKFSFLPYVKRQLNPRDCYIVHTSPEVHELLRSNLADSPLYNGDIESIGPRYCPSIETKIVTFADKESHQLFLEPEGETTQEFYINGFSSSLPWRVQYDALQLIPALRNVQIYRPGYAIEYDFFDPTQLYHTLETKLVGGLYFAGQICGTTGYEEAAGQGLMAGINAARSALGKSPFVLGRDQAYIGVLIDDLVTKGVDEPYRMFTSRAEYRILLRQDDADVRLTPLGYEIGLASEQRYQFVQSKLAQRDCLIEWCASFSVRPGDSLNLSLVKFGTSPISAPVKLIELVRRPQLGFNRLAEMIPEVAERLQEVEKDRQEEIIEAAEILIKYEGYIRREREAADKAHRLEDVIIPLNYDFSRITSISTEGRQKLERIRPQTIGQASRIPGVSPADINILLLMLGR